LKYKVSLTRTKIKTHRR